MDETRSQGPVDLDGRAQDVEYEFRVSQLVWQISRPMDNSRRFPGHSARQVEEQPFELRR